VVRARRHRAVTAAISYRPSDPGPPGPGERPVCRRAPPRGVAGGSGGSLPGLNRKSVLSWAGGSTRRSAAGPGESSSRTAPATAAPRPASPAPSTPTSKPKASGWSETSASASRGITRRAAPDGPRPRSHARHLLDGAIGSVRTYSKAPSSTLVTGTCARAGRPGFARWDLLDGAIGSVRTYSKAPSSTLVTGTCARRLRRERHACTARRSLPAGRMWVVLPASAFLLPALLAWFWAGGGVASGAWVPA
jgi:hypothetical protein